MSRSSSCSLIVIVVVISSGSTIDTRRHVQRVTTRPRQVHHTRGRVREKAAPTSHGHAFFPTGQWFADQWIADQCVADQCVADQWIADQWIADQWVADDHRSSHRVRTRTHPLRQPLSLGDVMHTHHSGAIHTHHSGAIHIHTHHSLRPARQGPWNAGQDSAADSCWGLLVVFLSISISVSLSASASLSRRSQESVVLLSISVSALSRRSEEDDVCQLHDA